MGPINETGKFWWGEQWTIGIFTAVCEQQSCEKNRFVSNEWKKEDNKNERYHEEKQERYGLLWRQSAKVREIEKERRDGKEM